MKIAGVQWDGGNWPKCGKHGVSKEEIEQAFDSIWFLAPVGHEAEERYRAVSNTADGRPVIVIFTFRGQGGKVYFRPVSARYMHEREVKSYEQAKKTMADLQDRR